MPYRAVEDGRPAIIFRAGRTRYRLSRMLDRGIRPAAGVRG